MTIPKPVMRNLLQSNIKKNIPIAIGLSFLALALTKYGVNEPLKQKYVDFYKSYDANAAFEKMNAAGVFQSTKLD